MISLVVTWDALPLLKAVHVSCSRLHLTKRILSLTQVADWASLRIFTLGTVNGMCMQHLAMLTYGMARPLSVQVHVASLDRGTGLWLNCCQISRSRQCLIVNGNHLTYRVMTMMLLV